MDKSIGRNDPCSCGSGEKFKRCHGGPRNIPRKGVWFPPNTVATFLDLDNQINVFTSDMIKNQFSKEQPRISAHFDKDFESDIDAISHELAIVTAYIHGSFRLEQDDEIPAVSECVSLLSNSIQSILAALTLLRSGFRVQPPAQLRLAIETTATAVALYVEPEHVDDFRNGKFGFPQAFKIAKNAIPVLGPFYGQLSEQFSHLGSLHKRPHLIETLDRDDSAAQMNLGLIKSMVIVVAIAAELIYFKLLADHRFWRRLDRGVYAYSPSEAEQRHQRDFIGHPLPGENKDTDENGQGDGLGS